MLCQASGWVDAMIQAVADEMRSGMEGARLLPGPRLLLIDTCGSEATVALAAGRAVMEERVLPGRSASEALVSVIAGVLAARGWRVADLHAVVAVRGPVSFTGVRVGLSAAKGLAEASGVPLLALSRLEVLASKVPGDAVAVLQAGRGEVFWAEVVGGVTREQGVAPRAWVEAQARSLGLPMVCEAGLMPEAAEGVREVTAVVAADGIPMALERLAGGAVEDAGLLDALYLHKTEQETLDRQRMARARAGEGR